MTQSFLSLWIFEFRRKQLIEWYFIPRSLLETGAINHNAGAQCFGRRHCKGIIPAPTNGWGQAVEWGRTLQATKLHLGSWERWAYHQRESCAHLFSVCLGHRYSLFISLVLCSALLGVILWRTIFWVYFEEKCVALLRTPCWHTKVSSVPETF